MNEFKKIIQNSGALYFTRQNLELILGSNRRTLDYRITSLIAGGILEAIKPGFYINKFELLKSSQKDVFVEYVGSVVKSPSYVSLTYALSKYNLIPEGVYAFTYITLKKPGEFASKSFVFKYRNIKKELFNGFETRKYKNLEYLFAKPYKALFDFIYLTPLKNKSELVELLSNSRINWGILSKEDRVGFIKLCDECGSKKMLRVKNYLVKEGLL